VEIKETLVTTVLALRKSIMTFSQFHQIAQLVLINVLLVL
jgi:hypothetical protein